MTVYAARTRPGPPENGRYQAGDTVADSNGVVWTCSKGGMAGPQGAAFTANEANWAANAAANAGTVNTSVAAYVAAAERGQDGFHQTVLTLTLCPIAMVDATVQGGGVKLYTMPQGRILILGCTASLAPVTQTAIATTVKSGVTGVWSVGQAVAAANAALTSTEADMIPSTAWVSSTVINVAAATVTGTLVGASAGPFDGTTTAIPVFLNACVTGATDIDGDGTVAWTGGITLTWVNLGDY